MAIIAILAALLLPTLSVAEEKGRQIHCLSNHKQLMLRWLMYIGDNAGQMARNENQGNNYPSWIQGNMTY